MVLSRRPRQGLDRCTWLEGDLLHPDSWYEGIVEFDPDVTVHLAWQGLPDYSLPTSMLNFRAGLELFEFLRSTNCRRVVVAGSCFEYGTLTGCVSEDQHPESMGLFAAFKASQRLVATSLLVGSAITLVWARIFFAYGPGQRSTSIIPSCYRALAAGRKPETRSPNIINDFIHVSDVAAGLATLATTTSPGGTYNLGSGTPTRVREVANTTARLLGLPEVYGPDDDPGVGFWADQSRIHTLTGWRPQLSLEEGIRQTIDVWRSGS